MARQAPRRNQDRVKTQLKFGMFGMRYQPALRGVDDARLLARRDRERRLVQAGAGLDLNEGYEIAPPGDDIDLAMGRPKPFGENAVALRHEKGGGAHLGGKAGAERRDPFGRSRLRGLIGQVAVSLRHGYPSRSLPSQFSFQFPWQALTRGHRRRGAAGRTVRPHAPPRP